MTSFSEQGVVQREMFFCTWRCAQRARGSTTWKKGVAFSKPTLTLYWCSYLFSRAHFVLCTISSTPLKYGFAGLWFSESDLFRQQVTAEKSLLACGVLVVEFSKVIIFLLCIYVCFFYEKSSRYWHFFLLQDHKLIQLSVLWCFRNSVQHIACCQYDLILSGQPDQSGSRCVIQRTGEVKNIMSARSPCGRSGMKGEEGCVFEVTHGFSQRRQINISLAFSSLQANSWDWPPFWSSVFVCLALPRCPLDVVCVWSHICGTPH